jgi:hypothetical protein
MDDRDVETPWLALQPSHVQVLFPQVEHASSLAELKRLGQKVYARSWTRSQRSAFWALWRARGQAMPVDTECSVARAKPSRRSPRLARSSPAPAQAASPSPSASRCSPPRRARPCCGRGITKPRPSGRSQPHSPGCQRCPGEGRCAGPQGGVIPTVHHASPARGCRAWHRLPTEWGIRKSSPRM